MTLPSSQRLSLSYLWHQKKITELFLKLSGPDLPLVIRNRVSGILAEHNLPPNDPASQPVVQGWSTSKVFTVWRRKGCALLVVLKGQGSV